MRALVINPDLDSRIRLKQAFNLIPQFKVVKVVSTLTEAFERLFSGESFGSLFVSTMFGKPVISEFIRRSKGTTGGRECAYILTFPGSPVKRTVTESTACGADGILMEPFSVDSLQKIYRIAVRVKRSYVAARQKQGLKHLLEDAADTIDHHAFLLSRFPDAPVPGAALKLQKALEQVAQSAEDAYIEALEEVFSTMSKPRKPAYRGASRRLQKKYGFQDPSSLPTPLLRVLERKDS